MLAKIVEFPAKENRENAIASVSSVLGFLNEVSAVADATNDMRQATRAIFELVCQYTQWPIGHLYVKETPTSHVFVSNDVWFFEKDLDQSAIADFKRISEDTVFENGKGIIGLIAEDKEAKAIADVTVLKQFLRADAAKRSGVRGFFGFPILVEGECVGVAEFYGRDIAKLDETSLELMQYVSAQLARIYERDGHTQQQQQLLLQFENSVQSAVQGLVDTSKALDDAGGGVQYQAQNNNAVCSKVVKGRNSITERMTTLHEAMAQLVDAENQTISSSNEVGQTVGQLSSNVHQAHKELSALGHMTAQIESIARNVSEIAGQVRMLGLNASIEAARAGEAGKGFAIVASEIKSLALQSEKSSQDIALQLGDIQKIAGSSAGLMLSVNKTMDNLENTTGQMGNVVRDQHKATQTIKEGLDETKATFSTIGQDIEKLNDTSDDLVGLSANVSTLVEKLQSISSEISQSSQGFITAMKDG